MRIAVSAGRGEAGSGPPGHCAPRVGRRRERASRVRAMRTFAFAFLALLTVGCNNEPDPAGYLLDFAGRLQGDLDELDGSLLRVAEQSETATDPGADPECVAGAGTCMICYGSVGVPSSGAWTVETDPQPCENTLTDARDLSSTYAVAESLLEGTYAMDGGVLTLSGTGTRSAMLTLDTTNSGTLEYDASYEVTELEAEIEDGALDSYTVAMTYAAFDGRAWTVEIEGTTTGVLGTVTAPGDRTCSIDGTFDDVRVGCVGPESSE